jgi:hypothetical protein
MILTDDDLQRLTDKPPRLWEVRDHRSLNELIASHRTQSKLIEELKKRLENWEHHSF